VTMADNQAQVEPAYNNFYVNDVFVVELEPENEEFKEKNCVDLYIRNLRTVAAGQKCDKKTESRSCVL
jgi:hypothetical protein